MEERAEDARAVGADERRGSSQAAFELGQADARGGLRVRPGHAHRQRGADEAREVLGATRATCTGSSPTARAGERHGRRREVLGDCRAVTEQAGLARGPRPDRRSAVARQRALALLDGLRGDAQHKAHPALCRRGGGLGDPDGLAQLSTALSPSVRPAAAPRPAAGASARSSGGTKRAPSASDAKLDRVDRLAEGAGVPMKLGSRAVIVRPGLGRWRQGRCEEPK